MKLNPTKCVFGVPAGMLLGYIVSQRGIEANPAKIKAIQSLKKPEELKDVQQLTGCIAALSRFISRLGEKAIPLYRLLKKSDKFVWDQEADDAFETLKKSKGRGARPGGSLSKGTIAVVCYCWTKSYEC